MLRLLRFSARTARGLEPWRFDRAVSGKFCCNQQRIPASPLFLRAGFASVTARRQKSEASVKDDPAPPANAAQTAVEPFSRLNLPVVCPGCGAPSQTVDPQAAGYYREKRVSKRTQRQQDEDAIFADALGRGIFEYDTTTESICAGDESTDQLPICDRCHYLHHHSTGVSIIHPSMDSIKSIIEESPHRYNHIYHIIDAADFPMSLIPNLVSALHLPRLRTQNRRSKSMNYVRGRVAEVSFIVTRSDLLAPQKEQVDRLLPYIQEVLRDALGRTGKNIRLGNVRLVSSNRGWWTKTVKEEIWRRGGAGWMVGKVNVGKSALVENVFPKGRMQDTSVARLRHEATRKAQQENVTELARFADGTTSYNPFQSSAHAKSDNEVTETQLEPWQETELQIEKQQEDKDVDEEEDFIFDEDDLSLLPPAQREVSYPTMPLVSSLPGTTASPIRLPYGNGKGELIDMPGIQRSSLDTFVKEEHAKSMILNHRVAPEQQVVKPGQSLLLGGLIRITPKTEDLVFLMYAFLPTALEPHVTSTDKAIAIHSGVDADTGGAYSGYVPSSATEAARSSMKTAGTFKLKWDVTKQRAGPVTDPTAGKQRAENLPYIVYSLDLLVEGVGWVEVVAQVRRRKQYDLMSEARMRNWGDDVAFEQAQPFPEIEVFTPEGKHVAVRRPMNGWLLGGPKKTPVHARRARPRQTISYKKRMEGGRLGSQRKQQAGNAADA